MERKTILIITLSMICTIIFLGFSFLIKDTQLIWYQTRLFGLLSYFFLVITILIGELRVITIDKSRITVFKYHKPIAIFSTILIALHFISAIFDNFKWGASLTFLQYLGFSFSDKWLVYLSFGTLAFYLILLIAITSSTQNIRKLGFKNWKSIHYFSYVSFIFAYIHSINLGTDIKHSLFSPVLSVFFHLTFAVIISILLARILFGIKLFSEQSEIALAVLLFLILIIGSIGIMQKYQNTTQKYDEISLKISEIQQQNIEYEQNNHNLSSEILKLKNQNELISNG